MAVNRCMRCSVEGSPRIRVLCPACVVKVTLRQGVYHQIKRMFGVYGAGVNALHRLSIGGVALDASLAPGQWRELTAAEVSALRG